MFYLTADNEQAYNHYLSLMLVVEIQNKSVMVSHYMQVVESKLTAEVCILLLDKGYKWLKNYLRKQNRSNTELMNMLAVECKCR